MSIYYVSNSGLDTNDGLTPETAWATIAKVNSEIKGGDEIRLHRGDTFYGKVEPVAGISAEQPTIYRDYGEGAKPFISQLKTIKKGVWEKFSENVWRVDLYNTDNFTGNITELDKNIGFLKIDGKIFFEKKFSLDALKNQWEFYCDDDNPKTPYAYIYSEKCPDDLCETLGVACNIHTFSLRDNLHIINIRTGETGGFGASYRSDGAYISGCEFHQIGGSRLVGYPSPDCRYGNGVEIFSESRNVIVENCDFSEIYDVAMTLQGEVTEYGWENVHFRNNKVWNCSQAFEIWMQGGKGGMKNCSFTGNVCIYSGYGWGCDARPNKTQASQLLIYHLTCPTLEMDISGNHIYDAPYSIIFKSDGPQAMPEGYNIHDNTIVRKEGQPLVLPYPDTTPEQLKKVEDEICTRNNVMNIPQCNYSTKA